MGQRARIFGALGGGISLATIAAFLGTCCVAPWAVVVFGVSGAVLIARLAFLQPYLLVAAAAAIALAFWQGSKVLHPQPGTMACDPARARRIRVALWTSAIIVALLAIASFLPMFVSFV